MIVRTGLNTTAGDMMRPLLHSHWARKHLRNFMGFYRKVMHQPSSTCLVVCMMMIVFIIQGLQLCYASMTHVASPGLLKQVLFILQCH